ncbi:shikimate kinase [Pluralibacter gergoviae]|nr:shikimate kinase [Pluralibacter gergoviae]
MAVAQCPASCGELIQGWILGSEKLVSCPIAWYSTVEVCQGKPLAQERQLARAMVIRVLQHFNCPPDISRDIRIEIHSTIPVAKGMASSTADIAATAVATAHYLGYALDEDELARLCVSIEPTDSTIFHNPTLFAHNDASVSISCPPSPRTRRAGAGKPGNAPHPRISSTCPLTRSAAGCSDSGAGVGKSAERVSDEQPGNHW